MIEPEILDRLLQSGATAWRDFSNACGARFHGFIPADHRGAYETLRRLKPKSNSFLELGSGVGVITILADLLGYDAHGIEVEPELVRISDDLAEEFQSRATFTEGSFVPVDDRDDVTLLGADFLTITEGGDAYAELGMLVSDFDLVYVYPWPGEEDWIHDLVKRNAGPHTELLTYSVREGFVLTSW